MELPTLEEAKQRDWGRDFWINWKKCGVVALSLLAIGILDHFGYRKEATVLTVIGLVVISSYFANRFGNQIDRMECKLGAILKQSKE